MAYVVYDINTGMILRGARSEADLKEMSDQSFAPNEIVLEGYYSDAKYYVVDHEAVPRPSIVIPSGMEIIGDDEDCFVMADLPAGTNIRVYDRNVPQADPNRSVVYVVDDGDFIWSTTKLGRYDFEVTFAFPYLDSSFSVTVVQ